MNCRWKAEENSISFYACMFVILSDRDLSVQATKLNQEKYHQNRQTQNGVILIESCQCCQLFLVGY